MVTPIIFKKEETPNTKTANLVGEYTFVKEDILINDKTGQQLTLSKRKWKQKGKPDYFLSRSNPDYQYISSLYNEPNDKIKARLVGSNIKQQKNDLILYFDDRVNFFALIILANKAEIVEL